MVASEYRKVKYFTGNGRISGLNGNFGRLNGEAGWEELAPEYWKTSRLSPVFKAPHVNPTCGAPRCTPPFYVRATLYDVVGSVKGHLGFTSREGPFFSSPIRIFSLSFSFISTKARFVNLAVDSGSTDHLFGLPVRGSMIHFSDAAIARGSKAPNQPSDELAFIRVAPGLPCLRTSCA